jgi:zinc protease
MLGISLGSVLVVVVIGMAVKFAQMSHGGRAVAEAMGGVQIDPGSGDPAERRVLNVVEEMAIASGVPVPPVFLIDEPSINAFAAGNGEQDAVIGVTRGCIERLSRDEIVKYHDTFYRPDATALMMVGDIDVETAVRIASTHLGDWVGTAPPVTEPPAAQRHAEPRVHLVHKSDAPQSEVRVGHIAIPRFHPDYFPVVVMNAILGGLFSSRLNLNLREQHAYTYGAHSAFDWRRAASPFEISTAVETAVTADALREIVAEFTRIREEPVSDAELSLAISYLVGVFPIRFETTAEVAGGLANVEIFRLPSNYFDTYRERVSAVTAQDVLRVAHTHLDPARLQVVVVGDADAIRDPIAALGLGPITVYDPLDDDGVA